MDELQSYNWPGNIREIENAIERALISSEGPVLNLADRLAATDPAPTARTAPRSLESIRARPHPGRPRTNAMQNRGKRRSRHSPGTQPQHPRRPHAQTRHPPFVNKPGHHAVIFGGMMSGALPPVRVNAHASDQPPADISCYRQRWATQSMTLTVATAGHSIAKMVDTEPSKRRGHQSSEMGQQPGISAHKAGTRGCRCSHRR
jgi:hypothetical protein